MHSLEIFTVFCLVMMISIVAESAAVSEATTTASPTTTGGSGCDSDEWQCSNGRCIPAEWRCDNVQYDCSDNSDEENCACGDHPNRIEVHGGKDHIVLGRVNLPNGETYQSCRNLCRKAFPNFQFYSKFINYRWCDCMKLTDGLTITLRPHGAYTTGYAQECGDTDSEMRSRNMGPKFD